MITLACDSGRMLCTTSLTLRSLERKSGDRKVQLETGQSTSTTVASDWSVTGFTSAAVCQSRQEVSDQTWNFMITIPVTSTIILFTVNVNFCMFDIIVIVICHTYMFLCLIHLYGRIWLSNSNAEGCHTRVTGVTTTGRSRKSHKRFTDYCWCHLSDIFCMCCLSMPWLHLCPALPCSTCTSREFLLG